MSPKTFGKNDPIMAEFKALLVSDAVKKIQFRFGPTQLLASDFSELAGKLSGPASWVSISIDPAQLNASGAEASYDPYFNQFVFRDELVLTQSPRPRQRGS